MVSLVDLLLTANVATDNGKPELASLILEARSEIQNSRARIAELQESVTRRDRLPADLSQQDAVAISGFQDFLAVNTKNKALKARIAELEAMGREAVEDEAKSNKGVRIALCELDRMEARIAELESRPDPPAPAAIEDVQRERLRQVSEEGWTTDHDDAHVRGELALAAVVYAVCDLRGASETVLGLWPWSTESLKASDRRRNLVRAAALIVAEIERVDRALDGKFSRKSAKPAAKEAGG